MRFRNLFFLLGVAWTAVLLVAAVPKGRAASGPDEPAAGPATPVTASEVHLYFANDSNSFLTAEQRKVLHGPGPTAFAAAIVKALIEGPRKSFVRTLPVGTKLEAVYVLADGRCFVDLSPAVRQKHPGGCRTELLTIYSVVNSLILNIAEIKTVKLLIAGAEVQTLAGHVDLQSFITANMLLIR